MPGSTCHSPSGAFPPGHSPLRRVLPACEPACDAACVADGCRAGWEWRWPGRALWAPRPVLPSGPGCRSAARYVLVEAPALRACRHGCGGTDIRHRRWHVRRVTKRPRRCAHQVGNFCPSPGAAGPYSTGRRRVGAQLSCFGPWGLDAFLGDPLGCPWSRGPLTPLYSGTRGSGTPGSTSLLLASNTGKSVGYAFEGPGGCLRGCTAPAARVPNEPRCRCCRTHCGSSNQSRPGWHREGR